MHCTIYSYSIEQQVGDCFVKFSNHTTLHDNDLNKWVQLKLDKPRSENTGVFLDDACNKFCNRLPSFGHSISHVYAKMRELESRLNKTDTEVAKKVNHDEFKAKVKKTKKKLKSKVLSLHAPILTPSIDRGSGGEA